MPDTISVPSIDTTGKARPALSATADLPRFVNGEPVEAVASGPVDAPAPDLSTATPAEKPNEATADTKPADDKTVEAKKEPTTDEEVEAALKRDETPAWMKARITKESNKRRAAEEKAATTEAARVEAARQLEEARTELETVRAKANEPKVAEEPQPKRETFDNPEAYDQALIEWSERRATKIATEAATRAQNEAKAAEDKASNEAKATAERERTTALFNETRTKALERYSDFEAVAESSEVLISPVMAAALINAGDEGRDIQYFLGKNPEEAKRISAMPFAPNQVFELGKIAEKLATKPKATVSRAPAPIEPLGSKAPAVEKTPDEMSMEEYAARRKPSDQGGDARHEPTRWFRRTHTLKTDSPV